MLMWRYIKITSFKNFFFCCLYSVILNPCQTFFFLLKSKNLEVEAVSDNYIPCKAMQGILSWSSLVAKNLTPQSKLINNSTVCIKCWKCSFVSYHFSQDYKTGKNIQMSNNHDPKDKLKCFLSKLHTKIVFGRSGQFRYVSNQCNLLNISIKHNSYSCVRLTKLQNGCAPTWTKYCSAK